MNLVSMLLTEGKSYKNYFDQNIKGKDAIFFNYANDQFAFKRLAKVGDPTATKESVGNYIDWIIRELKVKLKRMSLGRVKNSNVVYSTVSMMKGDLKYFHANKKEFKYQDIYKYSLKILREEVDKIEDEKATAKMKGAKPTFEFKGWKIIEIKTWKQACELGKGSKWCITSKDAPEEYMTYKSEGPIFFVVKGNRRWAITGRIPSVFTVWDEADNKLNVIGWTKENKVPSEVKVYLYRRYNKNES